MSRAYDLWTGNPKGIPEDKTQCVEAVYDSTRWHQRQCSRKRGHGPNGEYCKQHAKRFIVLTKSDKMRYCKLCGTELVCFDRYEHGGQKPGCPKCGRLHEDIILSTKPRGEDNEKQL